MSKTLVLNGTNFSANKLATVVLTQPVPCTGITLSESSKSVTSMSAFTLTATKTPSDTTDDVYWSTSDPDVATVVSGAVTPLKLGTVTISATCGEFSASCEVTIDNVVPVYKTICGYQPFRRTTTGDAATTGQKTGETSNYCIVAADQETGLYPIESKTDVDTSPYRFVPILIPDGATKIIVDSTETALGRLKTITLFFDSTKPETTYNNGGACCVYGPTGGSSSDWHPTSTTNPPIEIAIPENISGLDSCCVALLFQNAGTVGNDYTSTVGIKFSYDE